MKPSRTYTLGVIGASIQILLAVALLAVTWFAPEQLGIVAPTLAEFGMYGAACCGAGAGAMSLRDYGSGGLTSSQGDQVLQSSGHQYGPTP